MHYEYQTKGTCSSRILFDIEDGKLRNVEYIGGCSGNLQGIGRLVEGMPVDEVISRLRGIRCGYKPSSSQPKKPKHHQFIQGAFYHERSYRYHQRARRDWPVFTGDQGRLPRFCLRPAAHRPGDWRNARGRFRADEAVAHKRQGHHRGCRRLHGGRCEDHRLPRRHERLCCHERGLR